MLCDARTGAVVRGVILPVGGLTAAAQRACAGSTAVCTHRGPAPGTVLPSTVAAPLPENRLAPTPRTLILRPSRTSLVGNATLNVSPAGPRRAAAPGLRQSQWAPKRHSAPAVPGHGQGVAPDSTVPSAWRPRFDMCPGDPVLGGGAFAKVFRILERASGATFAMKVMNRPNFSMRGIGAQVDMEIEAMRRAVHQEACRHVIRLADVAEENDHVYLRLELCACDLLRYACQQPEQRLAEAEARKYTMQLMAGLSDLHRLSIIHRDLKPENLLLAEDGNLKIADFGWCADVRDAPSSLAGTLQYMAPEMLEGRDSQTEAVDVWSSGVTVWQLLTSKPFLTTYLGPGAAGSHVDPQQSTSIRTRWLLDEIRSKCPPSEKLRPKHLSDPGWDLLQGMLRQDVLERTSTAEALRHPWLLEERPSRSPRESSPAPPHSGAVSARTTTPMPASRSPRPAGAVVHQSMPTLTMGRSETAPQTLQEVQEKASCSEAASTASGGSGSPRQSPGAEVRAASPPPCAASPRTAPMKHVVKRWRTSEVLLHRPWSPGPAAVVSGGATAVVHVALSPPPRRIVARAAKAQTCVIRTTRAAAASPPRPVAGAEQRRGSPRLRQELGGRLSARAHERQPQSAQAEKELPATAGPA